MTPTGRVKIRSSRRPPINFWNVFQPRWATHRLPIATHHLTKRNVLQPEAIAARQAELERYRRYKKNRKRGIRSADQRPQSSSASRVTVRGYLRN